MIAVALGAGGLAMRYKWMTASYLIAILFATAGWLSMLAWAVSQFI